MIVLVVLGLPHLVLADVGDDQRTALGEPPQIVEHVGGEQPAVVRHVLDIAHGGVALELGDPAQPRGALAAADQRQQAAQGVADVTDQRDVDPDVLVDLGGVELAVNLPGTERVARQVAGDAVVEPHAERDEQIRLLDGGVDPRFAMHAHHPKVERMRGRHAAAILRMMQVEPSKLEWVT